MSVRLLVAGATMARAYLDGAPSTPVSLVCLSGQAERAERVLECFGQNKSNLLAVRECPVIRELAQKGISCRQDDASLHHAQTSGIFGNLKRRAASIEDRVNFVASPPSAEGGIEQAAVIGGPSHDQAMASRCLDGTDKVRIVPGNR